MALLKRSQRRRHGRGAAMVELALILPLLLMLTFGIIEYGWMFFCVAQMNLAARNGVRVAVRPAATETEVKTAIANIMNDMGWKESDDEYEVVLDDLVTSVGNPVRVTIDVPYETFGFGLPFLPVPTTVHGTATMAKEGPP